MRCWPVTWMPPFFVISAHSDAVNRLLRDPRITLADFTRAEAYGRRYRFLRHLDCPKVWSTWRPISRSGRCISSRPPPTWSASPDLHPAVVDLMLLAATEVHKEGGLFEGAGRVPDARPVGVSIKQ